MSQVDQDYVKEVVEGTLNERGRHDVKVDASLQTIEEIRVNYCLFKKDS